MTEAYMAVCAERDRYAEMCRVTALVLDGVKDERDRYKAEVSNVMGLMNVVVDERDRYRKALELIMNSDGISSAESMADFARAALENK